MTRTTLASGKVTLSVAPKRRMLLHKIQALAEKRKASISEQVWDLCERGLDKQTGVKARASTIALPAADLGRVLIADREDLYGDILADRF
ncbi:MAG: hypothetical protein WD688_05200 [Candidatus Binatia bacterium]